VSDCPRCAKPLEEAQVDTFTVRLCRGCTGMLVAHRDMTEILDRSWRSVPAEAAEQARFVRPEQPAADPSLRCPDCHQPMEKYGYMGLAAIMLDRCDRCSLLWLDADELRQMVLALAKSNYRSEKRLHSERDRLEIIGGGSDATEPGPTAPFQGMLVSALVGLLSRR